MKITRTFTAALPASGAIATAAGTVGKIPIRQAVRSIWPFYGAAFMTLMLVTFIPALSLWLPSVLH